MVAGAVCAVADSGAVRPTGARPAAGAAPVRVEPGPRVAGRAPATDQAGRGPPDAVLPRRPGPAGDRAPAPDPRGGRPVRVVRVAGRVRHPGDGPGVGVRRARAPVARHRDHRRAADENGPGRRPVAPGRVPAGVVRGRRARRQDGRGRRPAERARRPVRRVGPGPGRRAAADGRGQADAPADRPVRRRTVRPSGSAGRVQGAGLRRGGRRSVRRPRHRRKNHRGRRSCRPETVGVLRRSADRIDAGGRVGACLRLPRAERTGRTARAAAVVRRRKRLQRYRDRSRYADGTGAQCRMPLPPPR